MYPTFHILPYRGLRLALVTVIPATGSFRANDHNKTGFLFVVPEIFCLQHQVLMSDAAARCTRVGTLIVATIYLQLIKNRYMFRSFTVLQCSHQHYVQPVASDVEVVGYF